MNILITGITGFAGSHLADYILENHPEAKVFGTIRWRSRRDTIQHLDGKVKLIECDLKDQSSVKSVLAEVKPERIFHLAAQSFVPTSWSAPADTLDTNIISNLNIFEAVRQLGIDPLIQIACSSEEYGMVYENEVPIKEDNPLRPLSPYAVSKVAQDLLGYQYHQSYGIRVIRTRGFNHTGPRRGEVFVCSDFARQVAMIEAGLKEPVMSVGNLQAKRDFTDVRDMVRAYWLALEKATPGEVYNLCSGSCLPIQEVLDKLLKLSSVSITVKEDPKRLRPSDVQILLGDNSKFCKETGWTLQYTFDQTLEDLLNYWRDQLKVDAPQASKVLV